MTRPSPVTGPRVWVGAALVVVTVFAGTLSLRELLAPGPWWPVATAAVVATATATAAMRSRMRSRGAPTAWAALGVVLGAVALYGGPGTGPTAPVPTLETLQRLRRLLSSGTTAIAEGQIPVDATRGLELVVVLGVAAVLLAVDLAALGLGRAGLAGVPLAALWTASALFDRPPALWVLVVGGVSYLLLLTLTRPTAPVAAGSWWRDLGPGSVVAAVATVLAVALGPVVAAVPGYGSVSVPSGWGRPGPGGGGALSVSTDLDMRADLDERSAQPLLRYTTTSGVPIPLRLFTTTDFDGREWRRGPRADADALPLDGVLWPGPDDAPGPADEAEEVAVRVSDLDQDRLPIPVEPRSVEVSGRWVYDRRLDEVVAQGTSTRDTSYLLRVLPRPLTPDVLREDRSAARAEADEALALAESAYLADVAALAQEVVADATTDYDRAVALQSWFRDPTNFRYDTQLPPARTEDAVWDFLTDRTGYCVQFATAMAVMARTLGMPTRLAVGFLPGRPDPDVRGEYVVTGQQSHAWPEIWFEGAGWVRFEPTPAVQTGAPPMYADPNLAAPQPVPSEVPEVTAPTPTAPAPQANTAPGTGGGVTIGDTTVPPLGVAAGLAGVAVLVVAASVLAGRRGRRAQTVPVRPEAAWAHLRAELARRGVTWPDSATPRQVGQLVDAGYAGRDREADAADPATTERARRALERLLRAVETERYTPPRDDDPWSVAELEAWVREAVEPFGEPSADAGARSRGRRASRTR